MLYRDGIWSVSEVLWRTDVSDNSHFRNLSKSHLHIRVKDCRKIRHHQRSSHHYTNLNDQIPFWFVTHGFHKFSVWWQDKLATIEKDTDFVRKIKK